MLLTADKTVLTADYIYSLLAELYPPPKSIPDTILPLSGIAGSGSIFDDMDPEASMPDDNPYLELIRRTLRKNHGKRKKTAEELKISTSTLWRKIKKYHLDE